jgi:hypothetical protein
VKFATNKKTCINLNIGYDNRTIEEASTAKFLGLQIYNNLNWRKHIEYIFPKINSACFAMRTVTPLLKIDTSLVSVPSCRGVTFWGNLAESRRAFNIQKNIFTIMAGVKKESFVENCLRNLIYFPLQVNSDSHYCHLLWTACRSLK